MFPLPKLLILLVASSDGIPVVALPAPTRVASSAARLVYHHKKHNIAGQTRSSFFLCLLSQHLRGTHQGIVSFDGDRQHGPASTGEQAATPFRPNLLDIDRIVRLYQPIRGSGQSGTRSPQPEQSEHQQQQTADPAPYNAFTGILGPIDDASGTVGVTKSTIASSQMNATVTLDAAASAETASSTIRLVIMTTSTVGADATIETISGSLPSNDTSRFLGTTPPTSSFSIATTMTTTTIESVEMECLDKRAATPKSHRYSGSGSRGHKSHDRCQIESSSASTSDLAWWEIIPSPPALLLWSQSMIVAIGSMYAFAKAMLGCILCRSQPRDSTDVETRAETLEEKET